MPRRPGPHGPYRKGVVALVGDREWKIFRARLGQSVRDKRLELDVSLKTLAAAIGSHPDVIASIENNRPRGGRPREGVYIKTLFRIARGLGVTIHEVMP